MRPDRRQQAESWEVLKTSPLMQKWPDFRTQVLPASDFVQLAPGDFVFRRGDAPRYLFVVVVGSVLVRLHEGGDTWFEQEVKPGQVFGQQALWDEAYRTTARVAPQSQGAALLLVDASALRVALERGPELREELLHDTRAGRLRRIPLFRDMNDDQVRWLAQLVEERDLMAGAELVLRQNPGIWIVDRGQLAVTGPLNPYPNEWQAWRITAGNLLVAPGNPADPDPAKAMRLGLNCAADTATAIVDSHLFYLPAVHANRVIDQFPDVGKLIHQPVDIVATLDQAPLFHGLSALRKQHLAQFCGWEFVPEKQNITTQGSPGHTYVMLRDGGALITAYDNYGRERPRSRLQPRASYGQTALFKGSAREVTVRAVRGEPVRSGVPGLAGADIITLDRRDFLHAVAERPDLWSGEPLAREVETIKDAKPKYAWMQEAEEVRWSSRPHILWLIWPLGLTLLALLTLVVIVLLLPADLMVVGDIALVILGGVLVVVGIYAVVNYYDDYYAITNRRVTRRDRHLVLFEARAEAPVEMIQDVTINSDFWGRIFDYGDVTIRTASKGGAIQLAKTPRPYVVKDLLEATRTEAQAEERGRQKEELRRGLIKDLHLALPVPQRQRALGDVALPATGPTPTWLRRASRRQPKKQRVPTPPSTQAWLARHVSGLPPSLRKALVGTTPPSAPQRELPGMVLWRKHWINGLRRAGPPFLAFMAVLIGGLLLFASGFLGAIGISGTALALGWLVLLGATGFWLWWEFIDYRNDVYIVTDDRVIDIEMKPLGLDAKRREGGLERVQNVVARQQGVWAKVFGYGDVVISTAASDEGFTFMMVPQPQLVQSVIFQKLNAFRVRDERRRAAQRQQELIEALSVYHQLRGGGTQADSFS